jgi:hypothetical protein
VRGFQGLKRLNEDPEGASEIDVDEIDVPVMPGEYDY